MKIPSKKKRVSPKVPFNWVLRFKDKNLEHEFFESKRDYQLSVSVYSNIFLILFSLTLWAIDKEPLKTPNLIFNILKVPAMGGYLLARFKIPNKIELCIIILMLPFCGVVGDNLGERAGTADRIINSYLNGIYHEIFCLVWLLLRICWIKTALILFFLNSLMCFKYFDANSNWENNMRLFQICSVNFIFHSIFSYVMEKAERKNFFEIKKKGKSLHFLEKFIKESIPLGVIVFKSHEIIYHNQESQRLLQIENRDLTYDDLSVLELDEDADLGFDLQSCAELKATNPNKTFHNYLKNFNRSGIKRTTNFRGKKMLSGKIINKLNVKLNKIIWNDEFAVIMTLAEDISSIKLEYIQEFEIFKDRVLASVSHQFRTPLNGVMGTLENLAETCEDENMKKSLEIALGSSERLLSIVNDIIDFSQINLGKFSLSPSLFSINDLMKEVSQSFQPEAKKKEIEFIVENQTEEQRSLTKCKAFYNDPGRLKQVLSNLLSNAFRFTNKGFVKLSYQLKSAAYLGENSGKKDLTLSVCVEDSGCGINEDTLANLFEFFGKIQEKDYKNLNTDGMGFGLAISHRLLAVMNENFKQESPIQVKSTLGVGSTFNFLIKSLENSNRAPVIEISNDFSPILISETNEADRQIGGIDSYNLKSKAVRIDTDSEFLPINKKKKRVLIVDDDSINILVLSRYIKSYPELEFSTASNGLEALKKIEGDSEFYDLVLMDCNMPVLDGYEATKRIRAMIERKVIPEIPIIAVTANVLTSDLQRCLDCGMSNYLTKPLKKASVFEMLDKYLF